jgi:hypothetical protein
MGRRAVCDPLDAAEIVERITAGETTAVDAWRAYAATAVRPYARATFAGALSRARVSAGLPVAVNAMRNLKRGMSGHEIRERVGAAPVLVIGPDAALRVPGGALDVEQAPLAREDAQGDVRGHSRLLEGWRCSLYVPL